MITKETLKPGFKFVNPNINNISDEEYPYGVQGYNETNPFGKALDHYDIYSVTGGFDLGSVWNGTHWLVVGIFAGGLSEHRKRLTDSLLTQLQTD